MGIGNTTPAAALVAGILGLEPVAVVGRGTGIDDAGWMRKTTAIRDALTRARKSVGRDPEGLIRVVGGRDLATLAGMLVHAGTRRTPVILDGVVSCAAALAAERMAPGASAWWVAGHPLDRAGAGQGAGARSASSRSSTSGCASARAPGRCWPSDWCRRPPRRSPRWRPSTKPESVTATPRRRRRRRIAVGDPLTRLAPLRYVISLLTVIPVGRRPITLAERRRRPRPSRWPRSSGSFVWLPAAGVLIGRRVLLHDPPTWCRRCWLWRPSPC